MRFSSLYSGLGALKKYKRFKPNIQLVPTNIILAIAATILPLSTCRIANDIPRDMMCLISLQLGNGQRRVFKFSDHTSELIIDRNVHKQLRSVQYYKRIIIKRKDLTLNRCIPLQLHHKAVELHEGPQTPLRKFRRSPSSPEFQTNEE